MILSLLAQDLSVKQSLVQRIKTGASTSNVTYSLIELETIQQLEANRKLK